MPASTFFERAGLPAPAPEASGRCLLLSEPGRVLLLESDISEGMSDFLIDMDSRDNVKAFMPEDYPHGLLVGRFVRDHDNLAITDIRQATSKDWETFCTKNRLFGS